MSLEVSPLLAHDTAATIGAAKELYARAERPNLFIKIPGTKEGLLAIEESIFAGVRINVTLLFSREHYVAAAEAYLRGIERRIAAGLNPEISSVASLFISRWDVAVMGKVPEELRAQLGIAVAGQTYETYRSLVNEHGLKLATLVGALGKTLQAEPGKAETTDKDWYVAPLGELANYIVETHHGYMKTALPRLSSLVPTVLKAHGTHHGDVLRQVQDIFQALAAKLSSHFMKRERVLFPYIVALEAHVREGAPKPQTPFGAARNPIRQMEHEHESAGAALAKLREVTNNYILPPDACPTSRTLYEELQRMEADLHQHIHLENNILFPRTIELEIHPRHDLEPSVNMAAGLTMPVILTISKKDQRIPVAETRKIAAAMKGQANFVCHEIPHRDHDAALWVDVDLEKLQIRKAKSSTSRAGD